MGWRRPPESGTKPPAAMPGDTRPGSPVVVRYADDLVVLLPLQGAGRAGQGAGSPDGWRPGVLSSTRTRPRSCTSSEGFDFLGFNVRRYRNGKLLIKPSPAAVKRLRNRLAAEMRALRGSNAAAVIAALTPIIRGWAAYYRGVVSSKIFGELDNYVWKLT